MWGEEQSIRYCNRALVMICLFPLVLAVHLTGHTWPLRNYAPEESGAHSPILRIVRYLRTAFCKLQELPVIFCCCASRNCVVGFVKSVRSMSMQIRLICSWFQTFAVFWTLYAFFWVIPRCLNHSITVGTKCILRLCYNTLMRVLQDSHSEHYHNDAFIDTDVSEFVLWGICFVIEWTNRNQTLKHVAVTKLLQEKFNGGMLTE
jgi:hypothetical protein